MERERVAAPPRAVRAWGGPAAGLGQGADVFLPTPGARPCLLPRGEPDGALCAHADGCDGAGGCEIRLRPACVLRPGGPWNASFQSGRCAADGTFRGAKGLDDSMSILRILLVCLLIASGSLSAAVDGAESTASATVCAPVADAGGLDSAPESHGEVDDAGFPALPVRPPGPALGSAWPAPRPTAPPDVFLPVPPEPPSRA